MERIPSHSSLSSLGESAISIGGYDATEDHVDSSSQLIVGEGGIEAGGSLEHLAASFSSQHQQQTNNNTREAVRSGIAGLFDALGDSGEVHAGYVGVASVAGHEGGSLEERLRQVETSTAVNRARFEGNLRGFDAQHQQTMIRRMAETINENHHSLIRLLDDSNELPVENLRELKESLEDDRDNLEAITSSNTLQPETKEEGELKESKEAEMPVNFDTVLDQMRAALDNAHAAVQFLRANLPVARHDQEELIQQQVEVRRNSDSDDSNATHPEAVFEEESQGSSQGTVDQLTPPPLAPQENAVAENNPQLQHFIGRITGGANTQLSAYTFHRNSAETAEGRRNWNGAHLHWMSAVNRAANEMRAIEHHQQENDNMYHNPGIAGSLAEQHRGWTTLQNHALARARQAAENDRCCTIA